jgi:CheY-like chemotaxis protein
MLTPILVASDLLADFVAGKEAEQFLELIRKSVLKGTDLVQQIVAFAKGSGDAKTLIDLKEFGEESLALLKRTFPRNVVFEFQVDPNIRAAYGNKTQLHQVLLNLCVNARDAMPSGGKVRVTVEEETRNDSPETGEVFEAPHRFVLLQVQDNGCGIAKENIGKLFSPFFTTKKAGQGTGLGLPTVHNIIKAHQGFITVHSELGKGTRFKVYLPAGLPSESAALRETAHLRGDGEAVMLVGVDSSVVQLMRTALESHNYKVITAYNGHDAIALAEKLRREGIGLRVLVAETHISRGSVMEVIEKLRTLCPEIGTICTVGEGLFGTEHPQVDRILRKPFSTRDLLDAVAYSLLLHKRAVAA